MDWSFFIGMICAFCLLGSLFFIFDDFSGSWQRMFGVLLLAGSLLGMYSCSTDEDLARARAKDRAEEALKNNECKRPKIVSVVDGVTLWVTYPDGCNTNPVYFSKSGTQRDWVECTGGGKTLGCRDDRQIVPNQEENHDN